MKHFFNNIYLFVLFLFFNITGYAQLYPVQLTPIFNSPYSVKISDYATSMDTKMQLLVNPTDIAISQRQVRLKLYIQGNGLNIQSSDYIQGQRPIFINGGELQTLTNTDIAALFRLENLQGISPVQYANPLPEGMYNFCFEMYDFVTNQKISQKSCASLYLILNDPPLLNTPQRNEQIASTEFPNILFTWTPRQINATNISYKFELKQLLDPTLDPQFAFQMSPVLYEETLFSTALLYNLSMPILTPGMRYAWRVRAISTTGLSENAVFKNDGYSEIYSFKYTASCIAPTFLLSEAQNSKSVKITWEGVPEHTRYQVQYKKQDVRNAQWFSSNSLNTQSLLTNLEPGITYQFRVGSSCDPAADGVQSFTYSGISTFTTPTETSSVPAYNCGIIPEINIQNQKPLTNLIQSETFKAGDFPVTILELKGENSPYSGRGYIIVPYLGDTKIAVEFNSIVINTDYQLISGVVETSYNPASSNYVNVNEIINDFKGLIDELKNIFSIADKITKENVELAEEFQKGQLTEEQYNDKIGKNDLLLEDSFLKTDKALAKLAESDFATEEEIETLKKNNSSTKYASNDIKPNDVSKLAEKDTENRATILAKANEINEREEAYNEELSSFQEALKDGEYSYVNCKACTETKSGNGSASSGSITSIDQSSKWIKIESPPKISNKYIKCIIVNLTIENGKLKRYELGKKSIQGSPNVTSDKEEIKSFLAEVAKDSENKQSLWGNGDFLDCPALVEIKNIDPCEGKTEGFEKISQEIEDCINKAQGDKIKSNLQFITSQLRKNQEAEYYVNDSTVYRLKDNVVEKIVKPLSNQQIINGEWDDSSVESKMRFAINNNGNVALKAFGYFKKLENIDGKEVRLSELSKHITEQSNKFLEENKVATFEAKAPIFKNDDEQFADGKKIVVGGNGSSYIKIISDGASLVGTFVKTSTVEEQTYLTSTESSATIHAPGLVTGTIESGATVVTDITSLCAMVYDLSTDKKARTEMYTGLVKLKDAVKEEPSGVIPIFVQMLSGNTNDEWAEIAKKSADEGRKGHLYSRGVVTSVKTVIAGGMLITKLPKLAEELVGNIKKVTNTKFLKGIEDVLNSLDLKTLKKLSECQGFDKVLEDMTQYWTKFKGGKFQLEYAAKLIEDGKNVKFEVSKLSTAENRIYDIEATFVENGRTITKHFELKNWNGFYSSSIKNQFVTDLASMENLGDVQWVFNKTDNISDISTLKTKVIGALKNADGTAVEALDKIPRDQVKKIVGEDFGIITEANKSKVLLKALEDESFFKKIFKIVE